LQEQREWLQARSGAHAVIVAEEAGGVVGFASLSPYRERPAYSTTVEDSVYVRGDQRGSGVGRALLEQLIELAMQHGFHTVLARIVGGHDASIALHKAVGFEIIGTEREVGRKFNRWLDVVVMQRML
jgi:phosphinothricin acetyltransferase